MNKIFGLVMLLLLSSCCEMKSIFSCGGSASAMADRVEEKLRRHFTNGSSGSDVSTLIYEAKNASTYLKKAGMTKRANKFDSYVDVLTYGNKTITESINDVMRLAKKPRNRCVCH